MTIPRTGGAPTGDDLLDPGPVLVVGLGNPGPDYAATRHNVGAMVLDVLAHRTLPTPSRFAVHKRSNCDLVQTRDGERIVVYAKPRSYMNVSGGALVNAARFFSVPARNIIVVHDELDLDPGVLRLKRGGGEGGHNGLRSASKSLGTKEYLRVRVGIGRPPGRMDPADYVLKPFSASERRDLPVYLEEAADAVELLIRHGLTAAQNQVHRP